MKQYGFYYHKYFSLNLVVIKTGTENKLVGRDNEKWGKNLSLTLALSVTSFATLCFVPIFNFPFSRARSPFPVPLPSFPAPRFSNIPELQKGTTKRYTLLRRTNNFV